ncbi:MAG: UDP-3-O-[3-hydroxymyristoyl] N-acetylglucosamine deacetylase [Chlamydiae bacterium RIFCSPHIGHO2_12_FULL_27_8]|nr:MAG: UDP-3-O-[3-hydroxymyristoyl] N-acetylglucosamine deacetylase [Chlamydiae bacterium RIFCSPHIGHO2_12_FULL_27_8]OGN64932.1 MAG: UDP-3-O-[3-hydroxymyristoyl] N-acetylglucosamine deacetylase [Chlamydiae bacterium RIFCSPLOWO2_01_FULL_28_7]
MKKKNQKTINEKISFNGIGLFTGEKVSLNIYPADEDTGIVFLRKDLKNVPLIKIDLSLITESDRRTMIGLDKNSIQTVEHLLSALYSLEIDNALIEIYGSEIPIYDGSSKYFVEKFLEIGLKDQNKIKKFFSINNPVYFSEDFTHIIALPSNEFRISFTFHSKNTFIGSQYYSYLVDPESYLEQIAPCRTFSVYEEIKYILDNNFIKGGSLDNAVVIKDNAVLNKEGVRFKDEMVRHKILDMIGDLSLIGKRFNAHIISIKSGHLTNVKFAKLLNSHLVELS